MPTRKRKLDDLKRSANKPGQTKISFGVPSADTGNASGSQSNDVSDNTSSKEMVQLSLSLRWMDGENRNVKDLVGTYDISSIKLDILWTDVKLTLQQLGFLHGVPDEYDSADVLNDLPSYNVASEIRVTDENTNIVEQCYPDIPKSTYLSPGQPVESDNYQNAADTALIPDLECVTTFEKEDRNNSESPIEAASGQYVEKETVIEESTEKIETRVSSSMPLPANTSDSEDCSSDIPFILKPFHPPDNYIFKKTQNKAGDHSRSCLSKWFKMPPPNGFPWLHYRPESDTVVCFRCANQYQKGNLKTVPNLELSFITTGFSNWKNAIQKFNKHQNSQSHQTALMYATTVSRCKDIVEMTDSTRTLSRQNERDYFIKVMDTLQFLGRQGIALQGHDDNDNFTQALLFRGKDDSRVKKRLLEGSGKQTKYTHHDYQNEILDIMARHVLSDLLEDIRKSPFFAIMGDEYTDMANKEQLSICIRWIQAETLNVFEDFVGFYEIRDIKSDTIVNAIKDVLIRLQLPLDKLRGQTYDGASNMLGKKSGVATQIKELQPKALETHCHGHSLSLSVKDVTKELPILRDTLGTVGEMCVLVKYSPKREQLLGDIQKNIETDDSSENAKLHKLDKLCPTRWTVRANCYKKILDSYDPLFDLWELSLQNGNLDTEVKSRIIGCQTQMSKFSFYFGLTMRHKFYSMTDNLSRSLQSKKMSAITGQSLARATISVIEEMRNDRDAELMFKLVKQNASAHQRIDEPTLARKRNTPKYSLLNFLDGCTSTADAYHPKSPCDHFRQLYFEVIDAFICSLKDRFEQESYHHFAKLENVLLAAVKSGEVDKEGINLLRSSYSDDLNIDSMVVELPILASICKDDYIVCFEDILNSLRADPEKMVLIPNVISVVMLLLINPATSATPERSFSLARRIKTWTRTTMTQKRFNSLALLNCHKLRADKIDLVEIGNEFVSKYEERRITFGKFVTSDLR